MDISEKIRFLHELISCTHRIYRWEFDAGLVLLNTNSPEETRHLSLFRSEGFGQPLRQAIESGNSYPLILETDFGLLWITAFEYHDLRLERIHMLGPAFTGRNTRMLLQKKLDRFNLDVREYNYILRELEGVPIVPTNQLMQYAVMLHCAVTGAHITVDQVISSSFGSEDPFSAEQPARSELERITGEHRGIWEAEQRFLSLIREGNPDYARAMQASNTLSNGVRTDLGDPLRQNKNNLLVLLTLISRAAIEGGLSPSVSYNLNDDYAGRIEQAENLSQIIRLSREMTDDYVFRIRTQQEMRGISAAVREACDTIQLHLTERIRLSDLAAQAGYAEYYFSEKFRKEMGVSVSAYISAQRLQQARNMLLDTDLTIQEISDRLAFSNRSNFTTAFRKHFGITPKQLREGKTGTTP